MIFAKPLLLGLCLSGAPFMALSASEREVERSNAAYSQAVDIFADIAGRTPSLVLIHADAEWCGLTGVSALRERLRKEMLMGIATASSAVPDRQALATLLQLVRAMNDGFVLARINTLEIAGVAHGDSAAFRKLWCEKASQLASAALPKAGE